VCVCIAQAHCSLTCFAGVLCVCVRCAECASLPCRNGGTCVDGANGFTCTCPAGYSGRLCGTNTNECASSPCLHGICTDLLNGFSCACQSGYTGRFCETGTSYVFAADLPLCLCDDRTHSPPFRSVQTSTSARPLPVDTARPVSIRSTASRATARSAIGAASASLKSTRARPSRALCTVSVAPAPV
jgi:hypothetical protein